MNYNAIAIYLALLLFALGLGVLFGPTVGTAAVMVVCLFVIVANLL